MVQESTVICIDNSDWMRNGDMSPNRLQCEQEAVRVLIQYKLRSNPENAVGLISMADDINVLTSLTPEDRKILAKLHQVDIQGSAKVVRAIKTAHLVLKNRSNRNHKMRIVVFIGSPLDNLESEYGKGEFTKLGKKLKKENVKVDFVLFGEATSVINQLILDFVDVINGTDGVGSNVVVVPADSKLFEALLSSPICRGEDGVGGTAGEFDFGIDADEDPELALALRVSMEEQRQRQRQADAEAVDANPGDLSANIGPMDVDANKIAGASSSTSASAGVVSQPLKIDGLDPAAMTEEEQLQWALRMSMTSDAEKEKEGEKSLGVPGDFSAQKSSNIEENVSGAAASDTILLQPMSVYPSTTTTGSLSTDARGGGVSEGNKVDDEVLSSAGATASGTPAPTPMENAEGGDRAQHRTNELGQLMFNPDILQQLIDQLPETDSSESAGSGGGRRGIDKKNEKK